MAEVESDFVAVVVVNYFSEADTLRLLDDLVHQVEVELGIVVVDNSGELNEGVFSPLDTAADRARACLLHAGNGGYGAGNNLGIEWAVENWGPDFVLVCNPDIELGVTVLRDLLEHARLFPRAGIVGPRINTLSGRNQNPYLLDDFSAAEIRRQRLKYTHPFTSQLWGLLQYARVAACPSIRSEAHRIRRVPSVEQEADKEVFALHGSFMLLAASKLEAAGLLPLFDNRMFLFGEENYIAKRVQSADLTMAYFPRVEVLHKEDGSRTGRSRLGKRLWTLRLHRRAKRHLLRTMYR